MEFVVDARELLAKELALFHHLGEEFRLRNLRNDGGAYGAA